jgi:ATP-dependent Clp protease ATP-binding subunit ClpC
MGRALAKVLHGDAKEIIAVNCTEFKNPHDVAKLTGAPPGYVGHEHPPFLTPEKLQKKFTILIFEELEKADRALFDLLLQILERGELTTGQGVRLDFTRCLIFMTSNVGAKELDYLVRGEIGFHGAVLQELTEEQAAERICSTCMSALERFFNPEFINRIDEVIIFNSLRENHLQSILEKFLLDTRARFAMAGIGTIIDESAKKFLIEKGFNTRYGARPLRRAIRSFLEFPLASLVVQKGVAGNQVVHVSRNQDNLTFSLDQLKSGGVIG